MIQTATSQVFAEPEPVFHGLRPVAGFSRPMILTSMHWFSVARLAHTMVEAGYAVTCCRPVRHPLALVKGTHGQYKLSRLRPLRSVQEAIARVAPDIILPADEHAIDLLRALYERIRHDDPATADIVARSLCGVAPDELKSRTTSLAEMTKVGVACPKTEQIAGPQDLASWKPPFVLKTDGSYGGRGVAIVQTTDQLWKVSRTLSRPPSAIRAIKRLVIDRDPSAIDAWFRRKRPTVNAQAFVEGDLAIATAACNNGSILDVICMFVVRSSKLSGPATVVRIVDRPDMVAAAKSVVQRFQLSGFVGLDFIVDADNRAQLIEINARVTPTCHLLAEPKGAGTIALFPQELLRDPSSTFRLDLPRGSEALVEYGLGLVEKRKRAFSSVVKALLKSFDEKNGRDEPGHDEEYEVR